MVNSPTPALLEEYFGPPANAYTIGVIRPGRYFGDLHPVVAAKLTPYRHQQLLRLMAAAPYLEEHRQGSVRTLVGECFGGSFKGRETIAGWLGVSMAAVSTFLTDVRAAGVTLELDRLHKWDSSRHRLTVAVPLDPNRLVQMPTVLAGLDRATAAAIPVWRWLQKARIDPARDHTVPVAVIAADLDLHRTAVAAALAALEDLGLVEDDQDRDLIGIVRGDRERPQKETETPAEPVRGNRDTACAKTESVHRDIDADTYSTLCKPTVTPCSVSENGKGETNSHQPAKKPTQRARTVAANLLGNHHTTYTQHRRIISAVSRLLAADVAEPEIVRAVDTLHRQGPLNDAQSRAALLAHRLEQLDPEHLEKDQLDPVLYEPAKSYFERHEHLERPEPPEPELDLTIRDAEIAAIIAAELAGVVA